MLRIEELNAISRNLTRKKSTIVLGRKGAGKTWLLMHLKGIYVEYPGMKLILSAIIKEKDLYTERDPRYLTIAELLDVVRPKLKSTVLLLDEFDDARRPVIRLIEKLIIEGATVVAAGERKPWTGIFRETLALGPLPREDAVRLAYLTAREPEQIVIDMIVTKSLGYPGKIVELSNAYNIGFKNGDVNPCKTNSIIKFFSELKPEFPEKIDIMPLWLLFVIGFGLLAYKYVFYSNADWNTGYMVAAMGYISLIIYRLATGNKKRR